jgi:hypothetical protein
MKEIEILVNGHILQRDNSDYSGIVVLAELMSYGSYNFIGVRF